MRTVRGRLRSVRRRTTTAPHRAAERPRGVSRVLPHLRGACECRVLRVDASAAALAPGVREAGGLRGRVEA
eukprot:scaffold87480_cov45-Phaeocystis_antarctica.AAC.1